MLPPTEQNKGKNLSRVNISAEATWIFAIISIYMFFTVLSVSGISLQDSCLLMHSIFLQYFYC